MEQESTLISRKSIAIIGSGPAGCTCAKYLSDAGIEFSLFDKGKFLRTLLPTGGGRCNLAHADYEFKSLAKNYPRGEKFLYSVFSRFGTKETLEFFKSIGIETYTQEDNRIFPTSNSAKEVREKILESIKCDLINEKVESLTPLKSGYEIITNKCKYYFDIVVISIGGHSGYEILKDFEINIISPTQSLVGLVTKENFQSVTGVSLKNVVVKTDKNKLKGDMIFTHKGISGPLIYTVSSINARKNLPYKLTLQFLEDFNLQSILNKNPHKEIKNLVAQFVPKSFGQFMLDLANINSDMPCHKVDGSTRDKIYKLLTNFEIDIIGKVQDGEVVTCGGVDLNEINPKTMESKKYKGLYFCGEVLDIDGFCGGFNLQNCWSTGFICASSIIN